MTIRAIVDRIFEIMGAPGPPRWGVLADRPFERPVVADVDGTRRLAGGTPRVELGDGLTGTVGRYRRAAGGA